jgi:DNA-binding NarL/FixJ family response regulator
MDDRYLLLFSLGIAGIIKLKGLCFSRCAWRRVASENPMEKIRVLLADDHVVVREGTRELLEREPDIEVIGEANDGEEAVRLAKELKPDVAVLDIAMPKLNGIEATKQIREAHPSIAVLVLTAYDNDQYVFAILEAGAAGYLLKNVAGRQLIDAIRQVRAGQAVLHPIVARKVVDRFTRSGHRSSWNGPAAELTERELEVLKLAARGRSNKEIAAELFLSARTVQHHLTSIFTKLGVSSRTEAVLHALRMGWITMDDAW